MRTLAGIAAGLAGLAALGSAPAQADPIRPLAAASAKTLLAEGFAVKAGPVRFAAPGPVGRIDPAVVAVPGTERRALGRSAVTIRRGRGLVSPGALHALVAAQLRTRPAAVRVAADERAQAWEIAASEAVALDLVPRVLRAVGVRGAFSPVGIDVSEPELPVQGLWLRQVSTQACACPTGSARARAFRARFLAASDAARGAMVAGRFSVPLVSGPVGD